MKKRIFALLLVLSMLLTLFVGCGKKAEAPADDPAPVPEESATAQTEKSPEASEPEAEVPAEMSNIEILTSASYYQNTFDNGGYGSPVYQDMVEKTNTEFTIVSVDEDQMQIRIAGDDLGDMVVVSDLNKLTDMVESDLLMPLNEAIEEYAPWIISDMPELWEYACTMYPNDEGIAYALPVNRGNEGTTGYECRYMYVVRWDLYEQLGCPEIKNYDDYLKYLADAIALQPTTAEGKQVYGASFYVTDTSFYGLVNNIAATEGWRNLKSHFIHADVGTEDLIYTMTAEEGPYWSAVNFYNKAYRAGVLDPDCFTQQGADFQARIATGELICSEEMRDDDYEKAQLAIDPDSKAAYVGIPVEGAMWYENANQTIGWGAACMLGIPKSSSDPEAALRLIAYLYSDEGARTVKSGVQGLHWDYVDGVPVYNEETFQMILEGGDAYAKSGIYCTAFECMSGLTGAELVGDGYEVDLKQGADYYSRMTYTPGVQAYCDYYGVSNPIELHKQWVDAGKMFDLSSANFLNKLTANDEDVDRIDAACMKIAIEAIPKLVTAADDAAFDAIKAETLAAMEAAGAAEAEAFYVDAWNAARVDK